jgi:chromate transporter
MLGVIGFGGPMAHIAMMERDVIERRGWMSRPRFLDALAVTNLLPGPNSTEMGIHLGYARGGLAGALLAGTAFIAPAFGLMVLLSWLYFRYQATPAVDDVFYGIKPAVIALIAFTSWRLFRGAVRDWSLATIFVASGVLTYVYPGAEIFVLLGAGAVGIALYGPLRQRLGLPAIGVLVLAAPALAWDPGTLMDLALFCLRVGGLLFGGGYVIIPLMEHDVVETFGWMTREEFLDGVALGQATPGPIVITATFVGYGAAGFAGAAVATVAVFFPSFLFATLSARYLDTRLSIEALRSAIRAIAAAVVGAILATTAHLGESAFVDGWTAAIGLVAAAVLLRWNVHSALVIAAAALAGLSLGSIR